MNEIAQELLEIGFLKEASLEKICHIAMLDKVIVICYIRMQQEKADFWSEAKYGFKKNQNNFGYRRNHRSRI